MKPLSRRSVMAGSAAAVTAVFPQVGTPALALPVAAREGGELAALVRRYLAEVDAFNAWSLATSPPDDEFDARADATYNATLEEIVGTPARTAEDALAALDLIVREADNFDFTMEHPHFASLVNAIRGYIEGRVA